MGFDDSIWVARAEEKVLTMLAKAGSLDYYVLECFGPTMTAEELERNEATVPYNGYSLAFHMVYPLCKVIHLGATPLNDGNDDFAKLRTREIVLKFLVKHGEFEGEDAFVVSVQKQVARAEELKKHAIKADMIRRLEEMKEVDPAAHARLFAAVMEE